MKNTAEYKAEIEEKKLELTKLLLDYCQSQVGLWHQVPILAKELHRLNGFSRGRFQMASELYLWPIVPQFLNGLQVDLRNGILMNKSLVDTELGQISTLLEQLDAVKVIQFLTDEIRTLQQAQQFKNKAEGAIHEG